MDEGNDPEAQPTDDGFAEETWLRKANPSPGVGPTLSSIRAEKVAAQETRWDVPAAPPVLKPGAVVQIAGPDVLYVVDKGLETSGAKATLTFTTFDGLDWAAERSASASHRVDSGKPPRGKRIGPG